MSICLFVSLSVFLSLSDINLVVYLTKYFLVVVFTLVVDVIPLQQSAPEVITVAVSEQCGFQTWRWKLNKIYVAKLQG